MSTQKDPSIDLTIKTVFGIDDRKYAQEIMEIHPDKYQKSLAVARITFKSSGNNAYSTIIRRGTAWRVGSNNFMLTNYHVVEGKNIKDAKVYFSGGAYHCQSFHHETDCYFDNELEVSVDKLIRVNRELDYALFTLDPKVFNSGKLDKFGYLEIDPEGSHKYDAIYIPQHPTYFNNHKENKKLIAINETCPDISNEISECDSVINNTHFNKVFYTTDITPGSSGSPIISSQSHKVIALVNAESPRQNYGINMKYIWPEIKDLVN
ncbi:serine protease [Arsenophonus nasoniae]|uniref:S1 family peptidase n=1 Tax=Arsenophonus nasoniae TaxID=638 RepID=UPI00387A5E1B